MKACLSAKKSKSVVERFEADENLLGIGVGPKERGGQMTTELALKFFVRAKRAKKDLSAAEMLPKSVTARGSKVNTDVVQMAPLRARGSFTQRLRPGLRVQGQYLYHQ